MSGWSNFDTTHVMDEQENGQDDFVDIMAASMENPESDGKWPTLFVQLLSVLLGFIALPSLTKLIAGSEVSRL
jgi:hypothetical protein